MRVGIVTTSYPRFQGDFAGSFVADLAEALARLGHAVTVYAPHERGLSDHEVAEGVLVRRFRYAPEALELVAYGDGVANNIRRSRRALAALPLFVRGIRRAGRAAGLESDVVHVNWAQTASFVAAAKPAAPMVVTVHGSDVRLAQQGGRWLRDLKRALADPPTRAIIAVSRELGAHLTELVPGVTPVIVPTGVESELLSRERLTRHAKGPLRIVYVGRLLESKGVLDLADVFATLDRDATLTVVGEGPEARRMRERLAASLPETRWELTGALSRPEALDVMADADLVVVPSLSEGCGVVAIEASALGVPVIATRVGVHPELLAEDALFTPHHPVELTAKLRAIADDPERRRALADIARDHVAAEYTWDTLAVRIAEVYEHAVEAGR